MGNNCCVTREKESDLHKKSSKQDQGKGQKKSAKAELEKHENQETAQTIEFRVDTDGSADIMDMQSKRLSQLSDRLSDIQANKSESKNNQDSDIVYVEQIQPVIQDPLFHTIEEEQELNHESPKKQRVADQYARESSNQGSPQKDLGERPTQISKAQKHIDFQDESPIKKYVSEAQLETKQGSPFAVAKEALMEQDQEKMMFSAEALQSTPSKGSIISCEERKSSSRQSNYSDASEMDEFAFLLEVVCFLNNKLGQKAPGDAEERKINAGQKNIMRNQLKFYKQLLESNENDKTMTKLNSAQLERILCGFLPVLQIDRAKYLIGTDVKTVLVKQDILLVRTGGGFITLQEHITKITYMECIRLAQLMDKKKTSLRVVILGLLKDNLASQRAKDQFLVHAKEYENLFSQVQGILKLIQKRQEKEAKQRARVSGKKKNLIVKKSASNSPVKKF